MLELNLSGWGYRSAAISSSILFFFILFAGGADATEQGVTPSAEKAQGFSRYIELLLDRHPDLKSLNAALEAAKRVPDQAHSLPDPKLRFGLMNFTYSPLSFSAEGMTQKQVGISQMFPAPGKLKLRKKVAEDNVEIAAAMIPEKRLELIKQARSLFYRMLFLQKAKEIVKKNKEILKSFLKVSLTKYSVGSGLQQDVLKAQVEISKMSDLLRRVEQDILSTGENLSVLVDFPLNTDWSDLRIKQLPEITGEVEMLLKEAIDKRPMFNKLSTRIKKSKDMVELARKNLLPDYTLGMAYGQRDGGPMGLRDDVISLSVTLKIPWWHKTKQDQKIAENLILQDKAEYELESEKWHVRYQIADLLEIDKKDTDLLVLYNTGLIPQARQTVEASISDYQVDKVEFLTLVTNQITLFNFEIKRDNIELELQSTRTQLLRVLGRNKMEGVENVQ